MPPFGFEGEPAEASQGVETFTRDSEYTAQARHCGVSTVICDPFAYGVWWYVVYHMTETSVYGTASMHRSQAHPLILNPDMSSCRPRMPFCRCQDNDYFHGMRATVESYDNNDNTYRLLTASGIYIKHEIANLEPIHLPHGMSVVMNSSNPTFDGLPATVKEYDQSEHMYILTVEEGDLKGHDFKSRAENISPYDL